MQDTPELQNREMLDEIPGEGRVQSDHYRVLAHIHVNGSCRGGGDERPIAVAFGRRDIVRDHGGLRVTSGKRTPRRTARGSAALAVAQRRTAGQPGADSPSTRPSGGFAGEA